MGGRALSPLAYKLDRHTRSDYLDCHIYLERGAIHHSSAADFTRPTLIPSGGGSVCPSAASGGVCLLIRHWFNTSTHITQEEKAGEGSTLVKKQSAPGIPACVPAYLPFGTGTLTRVIITNKVGYFLPKSKPCFRGWHKPHHGGGGILVWFSGFEPCLLTDWTPGTPGKSQQDWRLHAPCRDHIASLPMLEGSWWWLPPSALSLGMGRLPCLAVPGTDGTPS